MVLTTALLLALGSQDSLIEEVSADRLMRTVRSLAMFHTRNTNSPGLTEACEWVAEQLHSHPRLQVELMTYRASGNRVPEAKDVVQVVAVLPGRTDRRILVGGHIDSLNLREDAVTGRAPGANDDASGTAVAMELARVMSKREWENTLVFVCFSGEEQGLLGSTALAQRAKDEGWKLEAVFNNDIVGNSANVAGFSDKKQVRLFSDEGADTQSRELARFTEWQVRQQMKDFRVKLVYRGDRFGRGGDHTPFHRQGFNAVRFCEVWEDFTRQHNGDDLPEYVDPEYVRRVAQANFAAMSALADAKPAPTRVRLNRRQGIDTTLNWEAAEGVEYVVYWRDTASPAWQGAIEVGATNAHTVVEINKDDHVFAVGAKGGLPVPAA
ncbi:MAG: M20/M25/M40 family metallo-hydrolase [Fimbriimonadaceae bacterium]